MDADSSSDNNSDTEQPIDDVTEEEKTRIRQEVSTMTFEELQKLKEEIGSKMYNKTIHGEKATSSSARSFKRVNKNRPREMSSKIKPRITKQPQNPLSKPKKVYHRDPRFDHKCGQFDKDQFKTNYKFIDNLKMNECKELKKELEAATDPTKKKQIKLLIQRYENQLRENKKHEVKTQKQNEEKHIFKQKKQSGEKPQYKKKSEKKIEELVEKYEALKKENKLQKHIERRSKKLMNKERKKLSHVKT